MSGTRQRDVSQREVCVYLLDRSAGNLYHAYQPPRTYVQGSRENIVAKKVTLVEHLNQVKARLKGNFGMVGKTAPEEEADQGPKKDPGSPSDAGGAREAGSGRG